MNELYKRVLVRLVLVLVGLGLILTVGIRAMGLLLPFLLAYVAAWLAEPGVAWLQRHGHLPRRVIAFTAVLLGSALLVAIVWWYLWLFGTELAQLAGSWQELLDAADQTLAPVRQWVLAPFGGNLQNLLGSLFDAVSDALLRLEPVVKTAATDWAAKAVQVVPTVLLAVLVAVMATYLTIDDYQNLSESLRRMMKQELFAPFVRVAELVRSIFGGYLFSAVVMAAAVSIVDMVGLLLLGVDYAAVLSLTMGVMDFLPYVGSGLILIPWCIYCAFTGQIQRALGLAVLYLVVFLLRNVLGRKVLGERYRHNSLLMLLWVYLGWNMGSVGGMILAQMLGMMVANVYRKGMLNGTIVDLRAIWHDLTERLRPTAHE